MSVVSIYVGGPWHGKRKHATDTSKFTHEMRGTWQVYYFLGYDKTGRNVMVWEPDLLTDPNGDYSLEDSPAAMLAMLSLGLELKENS